MVFATKFCLPMATGTVNEPPAGLDQQGILPHHAYSVSIVKELEEEGIRLIKVRNPHGKQIWTGDWCPTSNLWNEESRELLGHIDDEGEFFIPYNDYLE